MFTLNQIKFAYKSTQGFHHLATLRKCRCLLQVLYYSARRIIYMAFFTTFVDLPVDLRVRLATQRKSVRKFNLRLLASTCVTVWPGLNRQECLKWKKNVYCWVYIFSHIPYFGKILDGGQACSIDAKCT